MFYGLSAAIGKKWDLEVINKRNLQSAKNAKIDEFYTQIPDIKKEMGEYVKHNPDVFRGKTILLPCDDPTWSNFTKYFVENFSALGIRKLISSGYASGAVRKSKETLFSIGEEVRSDESARGKVLILDSSNKASCEVPDVNNLPWEYLEGDGDFRSAEVTAFRDEADFVITNPPFSLFREFIDWVRAGEVQFSLIGNVNAITYKNVSPLIASEEMWLGTSKGGGMVFRIANKGNTNESDRRKAERLDYKNTDTEMLTRMGNVCWFTSVEHGVRHEPLQLKTMTENLAENRRIANNPRSYRKYDNYDAIEVPVTVGIPSDYDGIMGVPISFLHKHCPEQFEILGSGRWAKSQAVLDAYTGSVVPPENDQKTTIDGVDTYARIFIRHRR